MRTRRPCTRIRASAVLGSALVLLVADLLTLAHPARAEPEVGIVTFTVDTAYADFFNRYMPEFFRRDIPGTLFAQTGAIGSAPNRISWDDLQSLPGHGWDFGAHGHRHLRLTEATDDELEAELGLPAARIYRETGVYPIMLASPYGAYDDRVLDRARIYYDANFRAWGNEGVHQPGATDHFRVNRSQVRSSMPVEMVCAEIERAGREGYWLVYIWHEIRETPATPYQNSVEQFLGVLDCADRLRDAGLVRLMTAGEALKVVPHQPR